ncbi:MAG: SH3 domain-containing protein [Chloroflexi bacterium]|nr:MAG: SH3 domain-containing protein [Chloroflexota bacterium]
MMLLFGVVVVSTIIAMSAAAQNDTPSVTVNDQVILNDSVRVTTVVSDGPGFVVIHVDDGTGSFGAVIGNAPVSDGVNENVIVPIDASQATPLMFAMLHTDDNEVGTYEFGSVEGADAPVVVDGEIVSPSFNSEIISANNQLINNNIITINSVTTQQDGFVVIHAGDAESFGAVLGQTAVSAGTTNNVTVEVAEDGRTDFLWPMLHVDDNTLGEYEFGTVEGADAPVVINGTVATLPISTVPNIDVRDQTTSGETVFVNSVLSDGPGFVVIHADADGSPGPVLGQSAVSSGLTTGIVVAVDQENLTSVVWPMLHVDDNTIGTYEFGSVEGADAPVVVNGNVVTFPIDLTVQMPDIPSIDVDDQAVIDTVTANSVTMNGPGFLVIHQEVDGAPGPVIGQTAVPDGTSTNVVVEIDPSMLTGRVWPMLHRDDNVIGTYEFGIVEGADAPVMTGGEVVTFPINVTNFESSGCTVSPTQGNVNVRAGASTDFAVVASLGFGENAAVSGQTEGFDGFAWWQLATGGWVRSDVVTTSGPCDDIAAVDSPALPVVPEPAATEEPSA